MRYQVKFVAGGDQTQRTPQNGIKAGLPLPGRQSDRFRTTNRDEPMPLPDMCAAHPVLPEAPAPKSLNSGLRQRALARSTRRQGVKKSATDEHRLTQMGKLGALVS